MLSGLLAQVSLGELMRSVPEIGLSSLCSSGCDGHVGIAFECRIADAPALILHLTYRIISCCLKCTAKLCFLVDA